MKTKTTTLALLLLVFTATQSMGQSGTIIGGAEWATANLNDSTSFTLNPDDYGAHFQWGRNLAWDINDPNDPNVYPFADYWATHHLTTDGGSPIPYPYIGTKWTNPPCPQGWKLPSAAELRALHNTGSTWANANTGRGNSVNGRFYGPNHATCTLAYNMDGCIFLPAGGFRGMFTGYLSSLGVEGSYWSIDWEVSEYAHGLRFEQYPQTYEYNGGSYTIPASQQAGQIAQSGGNIRCVRTPQHISNSGIVWATANLAAPGVFADKPDMLTEFYQWGKNEAWAATGSITGTWNTTPAAATAWTEDPCPSGWRLPTADEFQELADAGFEMAYPEYGRGNEVAGGFFGENASTCTLPDNMAGCIFLPASGARSNRNGGLSLSEESGFYWSSTQHTTANGRGMRFDDWGAGSLNPSKASGYNIRCVYDRAGASSASTQSISALSLVQANNYNATMQMYKMTEASIAAKSKVATTKAMLYPNPVTSGELTIDNGEFAIGEVRVMNSSGAVVRTQDFGSQTIGTLQLHGLRGTYFVRIGKTTQSIVVN